MTRRAALRSLSGACLVAAAVLAVSAPAAALAPDEVGWWFKANEDPTGVLPVQVEPPNVPEGGLYVANDPSGAAGVSAVRFFLPPDEAPAAVVTLTPSASATVADAAEIVACPALTAWVAAPEGGRWGTRPEADCTTAKVPGVPSEDGATVSWELPGAVFGDGGVYDVVLVPEPESSTPFQAPFEAPDDTTVQPAISPATTPTTEAQDFELEDLGVSEDSFTAPESPSPTSSPDFDVPGSVSPDVPAADTGGGGGGEGEGEFTLPTAPPRPDLTSEGFSVERAVAIGLLVAIGAVLWILSGQQARSPRLLGGLAGDGGETAAAGSAGPPRGRPSRPRTGGIGRFARARTQPPTRV